MTSGELAYDDYVAGCKQKEIAVKYNVSINTVKSWYNRTWKRWKANGHQSAAEAIEAEKGVHAEKVCTPKERRVHTKKDAHRDTIELDQAMLASVEANEELTEERRLFCYFVACGYSGTKAYMEAYECRYDSARANACRLIADDSIKECIRELKEIVKGEQILPTASEVFIRYAKLFYAKPSEFIDYGTEEEKDGDMAIKRNYLRFRDPATIDEEIISSVTLGKDGAKVEIDKNKALDFLTKWHELNPMDRHKKEYDNARLEIEREKVQGQTKIEGASDGFIEALNNKAVEVWNDEE